MKGPKQKRTNLISTLPSFSLRPADPSSPAGGAPPSPERAAPTSPYPPQIRRRAGVACPPRSPALPGWPSRPPSFSPSPSLTSLSLLLEVNDRGRRPERRRMKAARARRHPPHAPLPHARSGRLAWRCGLGASGSGLHDYYYFGVTMFSSGQRWRRVGWSWGWRGRRMR
jgi:hypothetical protein